MTNEVLKIHDIKNCQVKQKVANIFSWAAMGLQFTQHFFSQPVYFTNSRGNEPLCHIDCSLVKWEMKTPNSNRIFCSLSKLLKKCDICIPSDGLLFGSGLTKEIHDYL